MSEKTLRVVLVQLGARTSPLLRSNIKRLQRLFPNISLVIIHDRQSERSVTGIDGIELFEYTYQPWSPKSSDQLQNSERFRQGFWRLTLERLFAVTLFHHVHPEFTILHLENDVLLMPNFPFNDLRKYSFPTWCRYNDERDVASLLYLPDSHSSVWLHSELQRHRQLNPLITDMQALRNISRENPGKTRIFPSTICNPEYGINNFARPTSPEDALSIDSETKSYFGIFDPAAIGMWLCGLDPENHHGVLKLHHRGIIDSGDSFVDPSKLRYRLDEEGNVYAEGNNVTIPIYNLHIHSKQKKLFSDSWKDQLEQYVSLAAQNSESINRFDWRIFISVYQQQFQDRNLLRYIFSHPLIHPTVRRLYLYLTNFHRRISRK